MVNVALQNLTKAGGGGGRAVKIYQKKLHPFEMPMWRFKITRFNNQIMLHCCMQNVNVKVFTNYLP